MPASPGSAPSSAATRIITALQTLWLDPRIARGVLRLPRRQPGDRHRPGRATPSPARSCTRCARGEMAELGEVPFGRYYGSVDSTPLFVMLAGAYLERTGDLATRAGAVAEHRGGARLDRPLRRSRRRRLRRIRPRAPTNGLVNQGWKDSHDSVFHADGRLAEGPIALVEVQAYVYGAMARGGAHRPPPRLRRRRRAGLDAAAPALRQPLRRGLLVTRSSAPTCWRSTATSGRAGSAPRTPATRS